MDSIDSGFVLYYQGLRDHELFGMEKPFCRHNVFLWMLTEACRTKEGRKIKRKYKNGMITVQETYGSFCHSIRFMAKAWGWDKGRVQRIIEEMVSESMINTDKTQKILRITICNFKSYQMRQGINETQTRHKRDINETNYNRITGNQDIKKKTTSPPKFLPDSVEYKLTENAIEYIQMRWPKVKFSGAQIQKFCSMFEKAIRLDGYKPGDIDEIMQWVSEDNSPNGTNFCWADQWRSPAKLRQKDKQGMKYIDKWNELRKRSLYQNGRYKEGVFEQ